MNNYKTFLVNVLLATISLLIIFSSIKYSEDKRYKYFGKIISTLLNNEQNITVNSIIKSEMSKNEICNYDTEGLRYQIELFDPSLLKNELEKCEIEFKKILNNTKNLIKGKIDVYNNNLTPQELLRVRTSDTYLSLLTALIDIDNEIKFKTHYTPPILWYSPTPLANYILVFIGSLLLIIIFLIAFHFNFKKIK